MRCEPAEGVAYSAGAARATLPSRTTAARAPSAASSRIGSVRLYQVKRIGFVFMPPARQAARMPAADLPTAALPHLPAGASTASALWLAALGYGARWLAPCFARARAWQWLDATIAATMGVRSVALLRHALAGP